MKQKAILALAAIVLLATFTAVAHASYSYTEGIDGYVYGNGMPAEGIYVRVYNSTNGLEGYGVEPGPTKGLLGTDITDASGYFHIAWLLGEYADYTVVAETPSGDLVGSAPVIDLGCGETRHIRFDFCFEEEPGYTPGFWKHNIGVALNYNPGAYSAFNNGTKVTLIMLQGLAAEVGVSLEDAYAALTNGKTARTNMANAFNEAAGFGPFIDED